MARVACMRHFGTSVGQRQTVNTSYYSACQRHAGTSYTLFVTSYGGTELKCSLRALKRNA